MSRRPALRRAARRQVSSSVGRSLAREATTRLVLGAAGVLGARLASDLALPILERRLAAAREISEDDEEDVKSKRSRRERSRRNVEPEVASDGRARRRHA